MHNIGYLHIGTSHDTAEFACDAIRHWWQQHGQHQYSTATSILLLCDGGGSNSSRQYLFKQDLQALVNQLGVEIRIAHYPLYASKYNPIEHRLFPHLTLVCQGVIFKRVEMVKDLMAKARTQTGLTVFSTVMDKVYATGPKLLRSLSKRWRLYSISTYRNGTTQLNHSFDKIALHLIHDP